MDHSAWVGVRKNTKMQKELTWWKNIKRHENFQTFHLYLILHYPEEASQVAGGKEACLPMPETQVLTLSQKINKRKNGNPSSDAGNPTDREAWRAQVHRATKSEMMT